MAGPLEGLRVIDFGQFLAGPFGPMLLADLGADVIKVEPTRGDGMRGVTGSFMGCQRGKRDIALDLKQPEGLDAGIAVGRRRRHRAPQHDQGHGRPSRHRLRALPSSEARHPLLQQLHVRSRRTAVGDGRSRPPRPSGVGHRVGTRTGRRRRSSALVPLRSRRRRRGDAVGVGFAHRALPSAGDR